MTAAAAVAVSQSAGRDLQGAPAGDGGAPGKSPPAAPSSLDGLKRERSTLQRQLLRLQEARAELEAPGIELQRIDEERHALELANAGAVSDWVSRGCEESRPALDPGRLSSVDRRREIALAASNANRAPLAELAMQADAIRARLEAIDGEITAEAVAVLAGGLDVELAAIRTAADELNRALGRALGLRAFALSHRNNHAFMRLAEHISGLQTPAIGATNAEAASAAADWQRRFEELTE